uniref:Uncharacterized protein n=1 Tax=Knipowitschia caucasica TaxID=637954 RepID=A0AAV2MTI0_KNICA
MKRLRRSHTPGLFAIYGRQKSGNATLKPLNARVLLCRCSLRGYSSGSNDSPRAALMAPSPRSLRSPSARRAPSFSRIILLSSAAERSVFNGDESPS